MVLFLNHNANMQIEATLVGRFFRTTTQHSSSCSVPAKFRNKQFSHATLLVMNRMQCTRPRSELLHNETDSRSVEAQGRINREPFILCILGSA